MKGLKYLIYYITKYLFTYKNKYFTLCTRIIRHSVEGTFINVATLLEANMYNISMICNSEEHPVSNKKTNYRLIISIYTTQIYLLLVRAGYEFKFQEFIQFQFS